MFLTYYIDMAYFLACLSDYNDIKFPMYIHILFKVKKICNIITHFSNYKLTYFICKNHEISLCSIVLIRPSTAKLILKYELCLLKPRPHGEYSWAQQEFIGKPLSRYAYWVHQRDSFAKTYRKGIRHKLYINGRLRNYVRPIMNLYNHFF